MGLRDRLGRLKNSRAVGGISKIIEWANLNKATAAFLLIIFIAVGSVAGYKTTRWLETPQFCSISVCHTSMYPYAEYFIQSAHGQAQTNYKCMDCHGETRIGPIENKYLGVMLSHALDSPPVLIGLVEGKIPDPQFDPLYPTVPSERCLRCHAPDADIEDAYPVTAKDHSSPIDVSKEFEWVLENPRGNKYVCKNCHAFVVHPSDTELLPTERGKKYDYAHPGFPKINFGPWQQAHWHLLRDGGKGGNSITPATLRAVHTLLHRQVLRLMALKELLTKTCAKFAISYPGFDLRTWTVNARDVTTTAS